MLVCSLTPEQRKEGRKERTVHIFLIQIKFPKSHVNLSKGGKRGGVNGLSEMGKWIKRDCFFSGPRTSERGSGSQVLCLLYISSLSEAGQNGFFHCHLSLVLRVFPLSLSVCLGLFPVSCCSFAFKAKLLILLGREGKQEKEEGVGRKTNRNLEELLNLKKKR